jgi:hypothetical protein
MHGNIDDFNRTTDKPNGVSAKSVGIPAGDYTGEWSGYFVTIKKQSGKNVIQYRFRTNTGLRNLQPIPVRIQIRGGNAKVFIVK